MSPSVDVPSLGSRAGGDRHDGYYREIVFWRTSADGGRQLCPLANTD